MARFDAPSTLHEDSGIKQVKFGEGGRVLEVELNEAQEIQNYIRKLYASSMVTDGFINAPTVSYLNNVLTVKNAVALIGGELIQISTLTINLSEGQKAYLKIWDEEINYTTPIKKYGNVQESNIPNKILDPRENKETTRRIQTKYQLVNSVSEGDKYLTIGRISGGSFVKEYPMATINLQSLAQSVISSSGKTAEEKFTDLDNHINNKSNPHNVTKAQVGLGNVDNVKQATKAEFDAHVNRKDNPHSVTKSQVGLGNVENYGVASQSDAESGTANDKYMTPLRTKQLVDKFAETPAGAQAKVDALKNNEVEPLKTRVSNAETSINQLSNEVSSKVSRTEFESLQIGGRNLLLNSSKEFRIAEHSQWYATLAIINLAESGLKEGETVTFSVYVKTGPNGGARARLRWEDDSGGDVGSDLGTQLPENSERRIQVTGVVRQNATTLRLALNNVNNSEPYQSEYKEAKLEKGNKATDWTPAPEDVEAYAEQKAQEAIDAVEVGGRNLLLNSEDFDRWMGNAGATVTKTKVDMTEEWGISNAVRMKTIGGTDIVKLLYFTSGRLTEPMALDKVYTYSIYVKNMGTKDIRLHINGLGMPPNTSTTIPIKAGESGRFSITGKRRDNYDWFQPQFRPLDVSDDIDVIVGREKIEKGNKATDWTPAPEDIFAEITNVKNSSAPISHVGSGGSAHAKATQSLDGFMSKEDKAKLDGIQAGAEVNQNTFSNIKVGTSTVSADSKTDTLELVAGSNVVLTPDATNDKITIGLSSNVETKSGAQAKADAVQANLNAHIGTGGSAHALATSSAHGFMSSSDKAKLDGIQAGAEVNQNTFSTIKVGSTNVVADSKSDTLELVAGTNVVLTPDATNDKITIGLSSNVETVSGAQAKADAVQANLNAHIGSGGSSHALATTSAHGFMSSSDKSKLNGIQAGAEVNQNAFSNIKVGSTTVSADSKTDTLELVAGTNVVLTPDATNDKITIGLSSSVETVFGAQTKVNAHANRTDNPHNVTKAQVGLGNVANYGIATQADAEAGTANDKYMTPLRTMQLLDKKIYVSSTPPSNPRDGDLWIW